MKKSIHKTWRLITMTLFSLSLITTAQGETLKLSTAAPKGTPWVKHAEKSAENLNKLSGGQLTMEVFPASQLGSEFETIKQTARGRLDIGVFSIAAAATVVPEVNLLLTPFFWDSFEQAECAVDNHLLEVFAPLFEEKGLKVLQWQELGWQILFAKEKITHPDQLKGYKIRIAPSKNSNILWSALGASGVALPFVEVHPAIQTGLVDGGELPTISYIASGLGKKALHMTRTNHIYQPSIMLMSDKSFSRLEKAQQQQFIDSLESAQSLRTAVRDAILFFEKKHVDGGGFIHDLSDSERQEWSQRYTPANQNQLIDEIGGNAKTIFDKIQAAKRSCS